jgi:hypothetical protein
MLDKYDNQWVEDLTFREVYRRFGWHWAQSYGSLPANQSYLRDYLVKLFRLEGAHDLHQYQSVLQNELLFFLNWGCRMPRKRIPADKLWRY